MQATAVGVSGGSSSLKRTLAHMDKTLSSASGSHGRFGSGSACRVQFRSHSAKTSVARSRKSLPSRSVRRDARANSAVAAAGSRNVLKVFGGAELLAACFSRCSRSERARLHCARERAATTLSSGSRVFGRSKVRRLHTLSSEVRRLRRIVPGLHSHFAV